MFVTIFSEHIFILSLKHIHIFTHTHAHTHKQAALAGIKKCVSGAVSYSRSWKTRQASLSRKTDLPLLSFAALGNRHNKNKTVLSSSCIFLPRCLDTQRQSQSTFNQWKVGRTRRSTARWACVRLCRKQRRRDCEWQRHCLTWGLYLNQACVCYLACLYS